MRSKKLAFLGGGNMAEALLAGLLAEQQYLPGEIVAADIAAPRREQLARQYGVETTTDNRAAVQSAPIVMLAVKPQQAQEVLDEVREATSPRHLLISICAGLTTRWLEARSPARVVRVMPNLPVRVRRGVSALCRGSRASAEDLELSAKLFGAVGLVVRLPEDRMNEATALSGSGPGYVFAFMEALAAAGAALGLDAGQARQMAVETVRGAAELAAQSGADPAVLRQQVCSKGGTTLAGLAAMDAGGFSASVAAGLQAACRRAAELAGALS